MTKYTTTSAARLCQFWVHQAVVQQYALPCDIQGEGTRVPPRNRASRSLKRNHQGLALRSNARMLVNVCKAKVALTCAQLVVTNVGATFLFIQEIDRVLFKILSTFRWPLLPLPAVRTLSASAEFRTCPYLAAVKEMSQGSPLDCK